MKRIIISIMLLASIFLIGCTGKANTAVGYDTFAQCLTDKGVKMYGAEWCSHCQNQKAMFGSSFQYVDYVDCEQSQQECSIAGIQGYPTWKISGNDYPGEQSFERLASLSGCKL
ncbi:MAG: thioredoxin domain-containing protein [Candidatus Woesearchaeota archaeon]